MNWMKKGPDLKLSDLHVPDFAYDLYSDLKERHLLPLVAVLLVAIVAVPIYVKSKSHSAPEPLPHTAPIATGSSATTGDHGLVVARSEPGLRDYKRRLKGARPLDPFEEQGGKESSSEEAAAGETAPTGEGSPSSAAAVAAPEATVVGEEPSYSPPVEPVTPIEVTPPPVEIPATEPSTGGGKTRTRYASSAIDVRIVSVHGGSADAKKKPQAQVRRNLPELTMLPARATPAATFMGTSSDGKKALMLVSSDVVSLFGEANCVIGSQTCQLLALEPGMPETFVYGPKERTYRIEVLKIEHILSSKPRRAPLGATKQKAKQQEQPGPGTGSKPSGRG
jgi:hypothetical protein